VKQQKGEASILEQATRVYSECTVEVCNRGKSFLAFNVILLRWNL